MTTWFLVDHLEPVLGMERCVLELGSRLRSAGEDVRLVVGRGRSVSTDLPVDLLQQGTSTGGRLSRISNVRRYSEWSKRRTPQVVVVCGIWAAIPWLLTRNPPKTIVWEHSLIEEKVATSRSLRVLQFLARFLYRRAEVVVCVSAPAAEYTSRTILQTPVCRIHNIVELETPGKEAPPKTSASQKKLISIGSLSVTKRHVDLLRAMPLLPRHYRLDIYGDGPERTALEDLVNVLGIADRVAFHGYCEHSLVQAALQDSDILVHSAAGETFGLVYFEAASCDRYVVCRSNSVSRWLIPEYIAGSTYIGGSAELAATIMSVHESEDLQQDLARARLRRHDAFEHREIVDQWIDLVAKVRNG